MRAADAGSANSAVIPSPIERGSSGATRRAFFPSVSTSRVEGRSVATIGVPAAMYSNIFSGDSASAKWGFAGYGITPTSNARNHIGTSAFGTRSRKRRRLAGTPAARAISR